MLREVAGLVKRMVQCVDTLVPEISAMRKGVFNIEGLKVLVKNIISDVEEHEWLFDTDLPAAEVVSVNDVVMIMHIYVINSSNL